MIKEGLGLVKMGQKGFGLVRFGWGRSWKDKDIGGVGMWVWVDKVTMIDADKGQGKNSRWLHLPKQVKTVFKFLEFVVSMFFFFFFFLQMKIII